MTTFIDVSTDELSSEVELAQTVITVTPSEIDVPVGDANVVIVVDELLVDASAEPIELTVGMPDDQITVQIDSVAGPAGAAATVAVGSTTTGAPGTDASVVNVGTTSAAILDFTIPRGQSGGGGGSGIAPFVFDQVSPSAMWHVVHGEGFNPNVVVQNTAGVTIAAFGSIYALDANTVDLYFLTPITGVATLNF